MKWETAPLYLRRLIARPAAASRRTLRIEAATALGPLIDLLTYFAAIDVGTSSGRSQIISFMVAAALYYLPQVRTQLAASGRRWDLTLCAHLLVVSLLALFLRSGVFALLTNQWNWHGHAAIVLAVIATAGVMRPGYAYCAAYSNWNLCGGVGWRLGAVGVVAFALLLRLIYSGQVELLPEEAYYWNYSRHLDFGYLDHPPMVAWLISAGTAAFGDTEFGVRIGALCCGAVAAFFAFRLTRNLFGEPSGLVAVVLLQTLPFFFLTGMLMTPDAPLTAAWVAALYFLARALLAEHAKAWWWAGLCLGLGMLSKYTIGLLGVSVFMFMLFDARSRLWFRRWEPYGAALLALAVFSPVIVWNAHNDWASFLFQTSRRLAETPRFALHKLVASAVVLLTPTGLAAAVVLLVGQAPGTGGRDGSLEKRRAWHFIQAAILVPVVVFVIFSLRHEVKLDWTGAPWIAVVPALAFGVVYSGQNLVTGVRAWIRRAWTPTIIGALLIYGAGLYYLALGIPGVGYGKHAELIPEGWRELGSQVHGIAEGIAKTGGSDPLIVGMDRYAIASELAFYAPDRAKSVDDTSSAHLFGQVGLMYERWFPIAAEQGRTLLLVAWDRDDLAADRVRPSVERLDPIREGVLTRDGETIHQYYYRVAYGYRGLSGPN
jgi:dolichol-phosphate mannosyltransferase